MHQNVVQFAYLAAAVCFILGLKGLARPKTAVNANLLGASGMLLAIIATLLHHGVTSYAVIFAGLIVGGSIGFFLATRIQMTAMPQMVALLNGFGGGASAFVAGVALANAVRRFKVLGEPVDLPAGTSIPTVLSGFIGALTLTGSLVAFGKLQELVSGKPILFPNRRQINAGLLLVALLFGILLIAFPGAQIWYWLVVLVALALGVLLVIPIGGADMPVVIALLNSYSGVAAAATGFVIEEPILIVTGSLVGASGLILTRIMCKAMNRSLANVLFGGVGATPAGAPAAQDFYEGRVKATSPDEIAMVLEGARRVMIVPGYGLAVAQAQHAVRDLANALEAKGTVVEYAIHPVAGRMPGHMNVLLAEAQIPYEKLKEMDQANPLFAETDVAIVIGANDVVNPLARTDPTCPIAGMPILDVDKARTVIVVKRSLSPGFAGIPNPLFASDNTLLFFADGKKAVLEILAAVKSV